MLMGAYAESFIESLGMENYLGEFAKVLLKKKEDCDFFYIGYFGKNKRLVDDLLDYREFKLSIEDITFDLFSDMCDNEGIKSAFEKTFLQHISESSARLIEVTISAGGTSLEMIYDSFKNNPNENILKYVL